MVNNDKPTLTLVRGLPGSGKTTYVKNLKMPMSHHVEADMYFMRDGKYTFNPAELHKAHTWCKDIVREGLLSGKDMWCSNTFTTKSELMPYFKLAKELNVNLVVLTMNGGFKSIHDVPAETQIRMRNRFDLDLQSLWADYFK